MTGRATSRTRSASSNRCSVRFQLFAAVLIVANLSLAPFRSHDPPLTGSRHPQVVTCLFDYGYALLLAGDPARAEPVLRRALQHRFEYLHRTLHPDVTFYPLADMESRIGRAEHEERSVADAVAAAVRRFEESVSEPERRDIALPFHPSCLAAPWDYWLWRGAPTQGRDQLQPQQQQQHEQEEARDDAMQEWNARTSYTPMPL